MARKKKIFVSFDFDHDRNLKENFVSQARHRDTQFSINDSSLFERQPEEKWFAEANRRIAQCDVFITILGMHTHTAKGVLRETSMARGLNKTRFQLLPKRRHGPPLNKEDEGPTVIWKWKNLEKWLTTDRGRTQ